MDTMTSTITSKHDWAIQQVSRWWDQVNQRYHVDLGGCPLVEFSNRMTETAGRAWSRSRRIVLSNRYLHSVPQSDFDNVIGHEVAHIFADNYYNRNCHHGPLWRKVMLSLNLPADRCHAFKPVKPIIGINCHCGTFINVGSRRVTNIMNGAVYSCRKCHRQIQPTDPIVVKSPSMNGACDE